MLNSNKRKKQRRLPMLLMTVSIAMMVTLVSSAVSVGPFLIQSAWALPYVSSVSVSPSSTEKTKGETATYTVTVSRASGQGSGDVNLSFQSNSIPSSAATFSSTKVNFGNGGSNSKSVSLTINTNDLSIQEYTFTVKGTKSNAASDSATSSSTTLTVIEPPNQEPTANAGSDQTVNEGDTVSLDGSGSSDPDGDTLTYAWTQTAGTQVTLDDASSATPSFTAPDVGADGETLTLELTVDDGNGHTATDAVAININNVIVNQPPVASLTANPTTIDEGSTSALDASASTDDAGIAQYAFEQVGGTAGTITVDSTDPSKATFQAPSTSADETATIKVTVKDAEDLTDSATVDIAVKNVVHVTTLTLNTITNAPWGNPVTVTGKLTDNAASGAGIGGATIAFDGTGADNLPDVVTNADGTFTASGKSPATVATGWKVQAHFVSNTEYSGSDSIVQSYATTKHSVGSSITATKASVAWGQPNTFTVTLKDTATGLPLQGVTVTFDGTGAISIPSAVTGSDGKATGTGNSPNSVATGWTYQAHFAGDNLYSAKDSTLKTYSTLKHSVSLTLNLLPTTVGSGAVYKVSGVLKDTSAGGVAIGSKTISLTADSPITIADQTTDATGTYITKPTAPTTAGTYNIQSHFASDDLYSAKDSPIKTLTVS
jgi:hypothetical protein